MKSIQIAHVDFIQNLRYELVLNLQYFEDETRRIRADTASLLQRARSVVPRSKSVAPLDTIYS